jgi:hypothetical protein
MKSTPPPEFGALGLSGEFIKIGSHEFHGPCPKCSGVDRFAIFTDRPFPGWNFWCRQCHPDNGWIDEWWPELKQHKPIDFARMKIEQAEHAATELKAQIERAENVLAELRQAQSWLKYHEQMTREAAYQWMRWGIPELFQEYWKLGFDPEHVIYSNNEKWITPTMTIPIFEPLTWNVLNIKHRLINPPKPGDKYRPERSGLPQALFVAEPDNALAGTTFLVEGEKKAMVTFITADNPNVQVVGIPGKNPSRELLSKLDKCEPLYICLDPDASREARQIANDLHPSRCRIIELPDKIDDMILQHRLDKAWLNNVIRQAVKL